MTKLFSVKSLAFAGAAAFALTLAAAPQASAAVPKLEATVDYETGKLTVDANGNTLTETDDGYVVYYQAGKTIKDSKYNPVAAQMNKPDNKDHQIGMIDISNLMGKATTIGISVDGAAETATSVSIVASPKVKATYSAKTKVITLDKDVKGDLTSGASVGFKAQVKKGAYGKWEDVCANSVTDAVEKAKAIGTTLYIRVAKASGGVMTSPWSKDVKVKIAAQAKAPKVALNLNATKAFKWKISNKLEYKISTGAWKDGSNSDAGWDSIIKTSDPSKESIVSGDAITSDVNIYVRTKATEKKAASAIRILDLKKSVGSPTTSAVTVETTKASGKTATGASIKAVKAIQYSTDNGTKWKNLAAGKKVKLKNTEKTVLVRIPGDKKNFVLPSLNTKIETDFTTGKATVYSIDYKSEGVFTEKATLVEAK